MSKKHFDVYLDINGIWLECRACNHSFSSELFLRSRKDFDTIHASMCKKYAKWLGKKNVQS